MNSALEELNKWNNNGEKEKKYIYILLGAVIFNTFYLMTHTN